jgi:hypothetical protein
MRVNTIRHSAELARSPPRLRRWRRCLPEEASTGLTPHSAAKAASPCRPGRIVAGSDQQRGSYAVKARRILAWSEQGDGEDDDGSSGALVPPAEHILQAATLALLFCASAPGGVDSSPGARSTAQHAQGSSGTLPG